MKTYRGAIFDLDGTLFDTVADIADSANRVLAEYGCPGHDYAAYKTFVGRGFMDLLHRCFPAGTPVQWRQERPPERQSVRVIRWCRIRTGQKERFLLEWTVIFVKNFLVRIPAECGPFRG